jgi:hypothetical protein
MKPATIERVFGRGRVKMLTGDHVEVFREPLVPGERRRYTKRFLETGDADFRQWTDREWRILARLIGHGVRCVPDVARYHGDAEGIVRELTTYDAGISVDQWATLVPVSRQGSTQRHVFEDCAHWWALAHHCLAALDEIHALHVVHLDLKADNICVPLDPPGFDPELPGAHLCVDFGRLALIDFAFSLVSREKLRTPLPIGSQKDYPYQSPRLLAALDAGRAGDLSATQELDWRCDFFSLAAMLERFMCDDANSDDECDEGWTPERRRDARALIERLRACHDDDFALLRPHRELIEFTAVRLEAADLARSLASGWTLARDAEVVDVQIASTPMTRIVLGPLSPTRTTRVPVPTTVIVDPIPAVFRSRGAVPAVSTSAIDAHVASRAPRRRVSGFVAFAITFVVTSIAGALVLQSEPTLVGKMTDALPKLGFGNPFTHSERASESAPATDAAPTQPDARTDTPEVPQAERGEVSRATGNAPNDDAKAPARDASGEAAASSPAAPAPAPASSSASAPAPTPAPATAPASHAFSTARGDAHRGALHGAKKPPARSSTNVVTAQPHAPAVALATSPNRIDTPRPRTASVPPIPASRVTVTSYDPEAARLATAALTADAMRVAPFTKKTSESPQPGQPEMKEQSAPRGSVALPDVVLPGAVAPIAAATPEAPPVTRYEPMRAPEPPPPNAAKPTRRDRLQSTIEDLFRALGVVSPRTAPVEERSHPVERRLPPETSTAMANGEQDAIAYPRAVPVAPSRPVPSPPPVYIARADPVRIAPSPVIVAPEARADVSTDVEDELADRGRRMLSGAVPRVAEQARADASEALIMATTPEPQLSRRSLIDITQASWRSERVYHAPADGSAQARSLYVAARAAFAADRKDESFDLALRAFAANPRSPDTASFLAQHYLDQKPARPEAARQLALYALAISGSLRSARVDDWNTFAIASALTGRDLDARRAFLVELALSGDAERTCHAARRAYATFGEPLRDSLESLLYRLRASRDPPACARTTYRIAYDSRDPDAAESRPPRPRGTP